MDKILRRLAVAATIALTTVATASAASQNVAYRVTATALVRQDDGSFKERSVANVHLVAGDRLRYDIVAANLTDDPQLLNLRLKIPANVDFISTSDPKHAEVQPKTRSIAWHGEILEPQSSAAMHLTFRIASAAALTAPQAPKAGAAASATVAAPAVAAQPAQKLVEQELPEIQLSVDDVEVMGNDQVTAIAPPRVDFAAPKPSADPWGDVSKVFAVALLMLLLGFGFTIVLKVSSSGNNYAALDVFDRPGLAMPDVSSVRDAFRKA